MLVDEDGSQKTHTDLACPDASPFPNNPLMETATQRVETNNIGGSDATQ